MILGFKRTFHVLLSLQMITVPSEVKLFPCEPKLDGVRVNPSSKGERLYTKLGAMGGYTLN